MADDLSLVLERARQNRAAGAANRLAAVRPSAAVPMINGSAFHAGDRVFDLESGVSGQIVDRAPSTPFTSEAIFVQLEDGRVVTRLAEQLVARPTPPSAL